MKFRTSIILWQILLIGYVSASREALLTDDFVSHHPQWAWVTDEQVSRYCCGVDVIEFKSLSSSWSQTTRALPHWKRNNGFVGISALRTLPFLGFAIQKSRGSRSKIMLVDSANTLYEPSAYFSQDGERKLPFESGPVIVSFSILEENDLHVLLNRYYDNQDEISSIIFLPRASLVYPPVENHRLRDE